MQELSAEQMQARLQERIAKTHDYCAKQDPVRAIAQAKHAHGLLDEVLAGVKPGMRESEVRSVAEACFVRHGITQLWHPPYVRFGPHTLLTFQETAQEDRILQATDIAFLDLGIVSDGIEGDAGRTVVFGDDAEMKHVAEASRQIFERTRAYWKSENPTGIALYEFVYQQAATLGLKWNLDPAGHLIGAYPHKGWKRGINHFPESIEAGKWILEIQVRHPTRAVGSFYEDLLY